MVSDSGNEHCTDGTAREPIQQRGVYLMADTPLTAHPLVLEDGSGDKQLLSEVLREELDRDEIDELVSDLIQEANFRDRSAAKKGEL